MVRNAKMILDNNNLGNKKIRQKSKSAKKVTDISKSNDIGFRKSVFQKMMYTKHKR